MTNKIREMEIAYPHAPMLRAKVGGLALVLGLITACATKKNPAAVCNNGKCTDPGFPFCDVDGAVGGDPNTCIAVSCTPNQFAACDGASAISCNAAGDNYDTVNCPTGCSVDTNGCKPCPANTTTCSNGELDVCDASGVNHPQSCAVGCIDSPAPHCAYLEPRYVPDVCDTPATNTDLSIANAGEFDPNFDTNCTGGVVQQTGGPSICVVHYGTIEITSAGTLTMHNIADGTGRSVALVADDALTVDGTLDVSGNGPLSGPGGGFTQSGGGGSQTAAAGGAGGATAGGAGGSTTADGGGADAGAAMNDPALLAALIGGAAAMQGVDSGGHPIFGGGGGGGITLISCHASVTVTGTINAGGGGGDGASSIFKNGWGGGAGGYVVLQGIGISVTGSVFANGGGGGAGEQSGGQPGQPGADGSLSDTTPAHGGTPQGGGEGAGGAGGIEGAPAANGRKPTMTGAGPGGGGGSVGWLQTYTPTGQDPSLSLAHASPMFRPNGTARTR